MSDDHAPLAPISADVTRKMSFDFSSNCASMEADVLEALCEGYTRANQMMVRAEPDAYPCCFGCGNYRYIPPKNCRTVDRRTNKAIDPSCQHVHGAAQLHTHGEGTCIDLACMLAALLREKGGDPRARVIIDFQLDDEGLSIPGRYHAMVMRGDQTIVDPTIDNAHADGETPLGVGGCGCSTER